MKLDGKVAIITGGAGGIGRGLTRVFVREGARVLFVDTNREAGLALEAELGERAVFHHRDLSTEGAAEAIREAALIAFGRLDVLVNNANRSTPAPLLDTTPEIWAQAFGSSFTPTQRLMMVCHDLLAESGGSIINFASGAGLTGSPTQGAYAAAKEAIRGVSRVAANEWGPEGIRVNVVCPYALTEGVKWWTENYPEQAAAALASVPLGRIGDVEADIAPAVVFLAGDDSRYITGQTLMIDGGGLMVR
ncbi:SDR family oxidoreductase [Mycetocola lacteus]|uniref:SDR family oxidoreductase n=1 Tax=Mycetocola lacteus TaxID=76637 RepID=A0A3L7AUA7_9MICO|nr:SDR family oxidoreductase [Mycetocola lacteus]RLP84103.1 SDR family oxidoreductase [Mycetocola lacteus]